MRFALCACAVLLVALVAAPPAAAKEKKAKGPKGGHLYDPSWGRRSDITVRYWPLHSHPYVRF